MIVKSAFGHFIAPAIRWLWFCAHYPKRKPSENGSWYYRKRRRVFEARYQDQFLP
jgi:hypothetical protein